MVFKTDFRRVNARWNANIVDFLGKDEAICETALGRESGNICKLIEEKNGGSKNLVTLSL
jgi:hypothetical protein